MKNDNLWLELVMVISALLVGICLIMSAGGVASVPIEPEIECPDGQCPLDAQWLESIRSDSRPVGATAVAMDIPPSLRTENWGGGSCVHASTVSLLRWQGQHEMAEWWRANYIGGEYSDRLIKRMEAANLRYAYTLDADMRFLEWCVRTGRGAGLFYKPNHAINLVGLDAEYAYLLDNNDVSRPERTGEWERVPRSEFERRWRGYGGFGWTLVYQPPAPIPHLSGK